MKELVILFTFVGVDVGADTPPLPGGGDKVRVLCYKAIWFS